MQSSTDNAETGLFQRRDFLKMLGGAGILLAAEGSVNVWPLQAAPVPNAKNVIIFITDQERALQWFPENWAQENMPCQYAMAQTGVTFTSAFTNTAMCTPARTTLFTGLYPAQHLNVNTLAEGQSPLNHQLNPTYPNLATVMTAAGYEMVYIGKFHMSNAIDQASGVTIWDDIERYSFSQWDPPDAGRNTALGDYGGGYADHDGRFIDDAKTYLSNKITQLNTVGGKPFCLVVSLVNPHDVLGYPGTAAPGGAGNYIQGGYDVMENPSWSGNQWLVQQQGVGADWLKLANGAAPITLPPTVDENLSTNFKPTCQAEYLLKSAGLGPFPLNPQKVAYLNFYGNLMSYTDSLIGQVMDVLKTSTPVYHNTWVVRTSDHGEYGASHGGLRQKSFSVYDEAIKIPLIWSNPVAYPSGTGQLCDQLVGHVDFLPTLCSMLGINAQKYAFSGTDYSSLIKNPSGPAVQDYVLFTYDDIYCGQDSAPAYGLVAPPNRIRAVRQKDFVYAYYFDGNGVIPPQSEFYDLRPTSRGGTDWQESTASWFGGGPLQSINYSNWAYQVKGQTAPITREISAARAAAHPLLVGAIETKLQARPVQPSQAPQDFSINQINWTDDDGIVQSAVQITWLSRSTTEYQLQSSTDNGIWSNVGAAVAGNNGPMILIQPVTEEDIAYRLAWAPNPKTGQAPEPVLSTILSSTSV